MPARATDIALIENSIWGTEGKQQRRVKAAKPDWSACESGPVSAAAGMDAHAPFRCYVEKK